MKPSYMKVGESWGSPLPAVVTLDHFDGYWYIRRINVPGPLRGNGFGSELFDQVLADADAEGVTLRLDVYASGDLDTNDLIAWYERCGFVLISRIEAFMERKPKEVGHARTRRATVPDRRG